MMGVWKKFVKTFLPSASLLRLSNVDCSGEGIYKQCLLICFINELNNFREPLLSSIKLFIDHYKDMEVDIQRCSKI